MTMVYYHDGVPEIKLGDQVELGGGFLFLFRKLRGQVIYVPGISPMRPSMESDGLQWVAIDVPEKVLIKQLVDPDTCRLIKRTRLLGRGALSISDEQSLLMNRDSVN